MENGPVEIVDLPMNSMVIFHSYVSLPEDNITLYYDTLMLYLNVM